MQSRDFVVHRIDARLVCIFRIDARRFPDAVTKALPVSVLWQSGDLREPVDAISIEHARHLGRRDGALRLLAWHGALCRRRSLHLGGRGGNTDAEGSVRRPVGLAAAISRAYQPFGRRGMRARRSGGAALGARAPIPPVWLTATALPRRGSQRRPSFLKTSCCETSGA